MKLYSVVRRLWRYLNKEVNYKLINSEIKFDMESEAFRKYYIETIDGKVKCKWDELLSTGELLEIYEKNPEEAKKDFRLNELLKKKVPEPTVKDLMQSISDLEISLIESEVI